MKRPRILFTRVLFYIIFALCTGILGYIPPYMTQYVERLKESACHRPTHAAHSADPDNGGAHRHDHTRVDSAAPARRASRGAPERVKAKKTWRAYPIQDTAPTTLIRDLAEEKSRQPE